MATKKYPEGGKSFNRVPRRGEGTMFGPPGPIGPPQGDPVVEATSIMKDQMEWKKIRTQVAREMRSVRRQRATTLSVSSPQVERGALRQFERGTLRARAAAVSFDRENIIRWTTRELSRTGKMLTKGLPGLAAMDLAERIRNARKRKGEKKG